MPSSSLRGREPISAAAAAWFGLGPAQLLVLGGRRWAQDDQLAASRRLLGVVGHRHLRSGEGG
jgi:hypothetical protein